MQMDGSNADDASMMCSGLCRCYWVLGVLLVCEAYLSQHQMRLSFRPLGELVYMEGGKERGRLSRKA